MERSGIEICTCVEDAIESFEDAALGAFSMVAEQNCGHRGSQGQGIESGNGDGESDGESELAEKNSGGAGKRATGTNTATRTSEVAMTAPATSFMATEAALCGSVMPSAMWRSTFSMTTMASSTTRPVARVMPKSVRVLMEKPRSFTKMKGTDQRNWNGDRGNEGAAPVLEKYVDYKHDQHYGLEQGNQYIANRLADDRGGIESHGILHAGWKRF